ncbi:ATP/GTP-binding protein [Rhodococcus sp. NPDC058521]|uniref:ATP/GTP-binding protein n=1 Tax=Rhodococcus sp. NPDC058521 TaxID=3346536 RepID=UPI0036664C05
MPRRKPQPRTRRTRSTGASAGDSLFGGATARHEQGPPGSTDDTYLVRNVPGARATKSYRCPGCDHEIRPGVAHVVTWPAGFGGVDDRRHWHSGCWSGRRTRGITRKWS